MNLPQPLPTLPMLLSAAALLLLDAGAVAARDRGVNQPGAIGNRPPAAATPGIDPGVNQPGRLGNRSPGPRRADPGINPPDALGNAPALRHRDPGLNQLGAAGNRRLP